MAFDGTLAMDYDERIVQDWSVLEAQPKYDGIRCKIVPMRVATARKRTVVTSTCTRSNGYIPNNYVRELLDQWVPVGLDGELVANSFSETMSALTKHDGAPDFTFFVYDYAPGNLLNDQPYSVRMQYAQTKLSLPPFVKFTDFWPVKSEAELKRISDTLLGKGQEGVILRRIDLPHVPGRSSRKLPAVQRIKFWADCEARIDKVIAETWHDCETNRRLRPEQIGKPKDFASSFQCTGLEGTEFAGKTFRAPLSVTDAVAREYLANSDSLVGALAKVRYLKAGVVNKPRLPVCVGVRHDFDVAEG